MGRAAVPSGASTGSREALELRDGGQEYGGKGVGKAVANVSDLISPHLLGMDAGQQAEIDRKLIEIDGTENKSKLGANATLAVSLAVAKAAANSKGVQLYSHIGDISGNNTFSMPLPMLNIFNGGQHANGSTDIQEFMIIPIGANNFSGALRMSSEIYHSLGKLLKSKGYSTAVGDEGGYAPAVSGGTEEALDLIKQAVESAGYDFGSDIKIALDVAASELESGGVYNFAREESSYTTQELIEKYQLLIEKYPIISIEDGLSEDDWDGWSLQNSKIGDKIQLVGDDLLVTNAKILKQAIDKKCANAILIKPNQIGTLTETIDAINTAKNAGWNTVISHRSGETEDTTIAHLAVGTNAGQIKTGSFARSERVAKYNELIRIAETLNEPILDNPFRDYK